MLYIQMYASHLSPKVTFLNDNRFAQTVEMASQYKLFVHQHISHFQ